MKVIIKCVNIKLLDLYSCFHYILNAPSNVQQNIDQLQTPTMRVTINKKSITAEQLPSNGQLPKPPGGGGA